MNEVQIYCPLDLVEVTPQYCSETYSVEWFSNGTVYAKFISQNTNLQMIAFDFEAVTNNGSTIFINLIYVKNGVSVIAQTFNLGTLPSPTRKYHFLDSGVSFYGDTELTLEIITTNGTSGEISITLDCEVDVASQDFCFVPEGINPLDSCLDCNVTKRVYWEQLFNGQQKLNFSYGNWYKDPELQTPADCGFYRVDGPNGTIWRVCGAGPVFENTCQSLLFDCFGTSQRTHTSSNYTYSNPYLPGTPNITQTPLKYSVQTSTLELEDDEPTNFDVVLRYTGSASEVGFTISDPNTKSPAVGYISYSSETTPNTFVPVLMNTLLLITGATKELRVKLNLNTESSFRTKTIRFRHFVGNRAGTTPTTVYTSVFADCNTKAPTYIYSGGVHPYSSYDSLINPKTFTYLYSLTPIASWAVGTRVYCDWSLSQFAYPWYYGIENKSYKVGQPFYRDYGQIKFYQVKTSQWKDFKKQMGWAKQNYKITQKIEGPKRWGDENFVPACLEPSMITGKITKIINQVNLVPPSSYLYLMGYSASGFVQANDSVFTYYDWNNDIQIPITGYQHSTLKLAPGYLAGLPAEVREYVVGLSNTSLTSFALGSLGYAIAVFYVVKLIPQIFTFGGASLPAAATAQYAPWYLLGMSCRHGFLLLGQTVFIIAIIVIIILTILFFVNSKKTISEPCRQFYKRYTTTPYIEIGDLLYRLNNPSAIVPGYYCDGAYFYQVNNSGNVISKSLSYTIKYGRTEASILPDKPSYITDPGKLFFLCYTAGIPNFYPKN
jgi:hypothetical protein